jgi:hypothetical protein
MDARIEGQIRRIAHAIPQPRSGGPISPRAASAPAGPAPPELFDANGDGVIENWSIAHGGDSFANFDPPPDGATGADTKRPANAPAPPPAHPVDHKNSRASTPVAIQHAHDAYQRDGVSAAGPADTAGAATASAAPADSTSAPAPMPVPEAPGPLRSSPP